jgi:hypothetical protein
MLAVLVSCLIVAISSHVGQGFVKNARISGSRTLCGPASESAANEGSKRVHHCAATD